MSVAGWGAGWGGMADEDSVAGPVAGSGVEGCWTTGGAEACSCAKFWPVGPVAEAGAGDGAAMAAWGTWGCWVLASFSASAGRVLFCGSSVIAHQPSEFEVILISKVII